MFGHKDEDKEAWFEEAKRSYEQFLHKRAERGAGLGTFSELEAQAVEAGDRLARFLIEKAISAESPQIPAQECNCPRCQKAAKLKAQGPERREICAKPGQVSLERHAYDCPSCRKIFFSGRSSTRSQG